MQLICPENSSYVDRLPYLPNRILGIPTQVLLQRTMLVYHPGKQTLSSAFVILPSYMLSEATTRPRIGPFQVQFHVSSRVGHSILDFSSAITFATPRHCLRNRCAWQSILRTLPYLKSGRRFYLSGRFSWHPIFLAGKISGGHIHRKRSERALTYYLSRFMCVGKTRGTVEVQYLSAGKAWGAYLKVP